MDDTHAERTLKAARALRAGLLLVINQVDELCDLLELNPDGLRERAPVVAELAGGALRVERATYSVHLNGKRCMLGPTRAFQFLERLARRPNQYIQTDVLIDELWSGPRAYSTVRSTVCRLKARLREAEMGDLAERIDGSKPNHYGLMLFDHFNRDSTRLQRQCNRRVR